MKQKLLTLMTLLLCAVSGAWADTELLNVDFTTWGAKTIVAAATTTAVTIDDPMEMYFKSTSTSKSITTDSEHGLNFDGQNMSTSNGYAAVKLTGINKSITVTITHEYTSKKPTFKYYYKDGATTFEDPGGSTATSPMSNNGDPVVITINSLKETEGIFYFGENSSSYKYIKTITITTPEASGKADPVLSVSPTSVALSVEGTQQITATATSTGAITYESSNTNVATVNSSGLITAVGIGDATITTTIAETGEYDSDFKTTNVIVKPSALTITKFATFNGSAESSPENYFTVTNPGDYNTKFAGTYGGTNYTSGLKFNSDTSVDFTTTSACDLVVVQSLWSTQLIKIDGTNYARNYDTQTYYDDTANKVRVYTLKNLAAGSHSITRNSEFGLLYIGVTESLTPKCATPTIYPADGGTFVGSNSVTINTETDGASIYYTLDGTTPTSGSTLYDPANKPTITTTTTVKAIAVKADYDDSDVATAKITKVITSTVNEWDFSNWSDATKTGILADDTNWSIYEKINDDVESSDLSGKVQTNKIAKEGVLVYGSTTIPETDGLNFNIGSHTLGIAYNQGTTDLGTYEGSQYLWLYNSSSKIIIPDVVAGSTIQIGVESHKIAESRTLTVTNTTEGSVSATTYTNASFTASATGNVQISPSKGMHIYYIRVKKNKEIENVSSYGWSTYITKTAVAFDANTAYVITNVEGSSITTAAVTSVPANTAVLLKDEGEKTIDPQASASAPETNLLSVCDGNANGTKVPYVLAKDGASAGFKKWTGDIAKLNGRVVLWLDAEVAARDFFSLDETTGINKVSQKANTDNQYYNLAGQRVAQPTKGLYIVNGKKVIIK